MTALTQRRDRHTYDVQAVVKIFAEMPGSNASEQVAVRCGDHSNVDLQFRTIGSDRMNFTSFEEPQQNTLHTGRHLA